MRCSYNILQISYFKKMQKENFLKILTTHNLLKNIVIIVLFLNLKIIPKVVMSAVHAGNRIWKKVEF